MRQVNTAFTIEVLLSGTTLPLKKTITIEMKRSLMSTLSYLGILVPRPLSVLHLGQFQVTLSKRN